MLIPFDAANPPEEPPVDADRLLWAVAYELRAAHRSDSTGFCQSPACRGDFQLAPCKAAKLAEAGWRTDPPTYLDRQRSPMVNIPACWWPSLR